jgi:hypothetical protein
MVDTAIRLTLRSGILHRLTVACRVTLYRSDLSPANRHESCCTDVKFGVAADFCEGFEARGRDRGIARCIQWLRPLDAWSLRAASVQSVLTRLCLSVDSFWGLIVTLTCRPAAAAAGYTPQH